ncbi:tetratricopeptide repeat protein [Candidatus Sumerlaeota bacterium]|nr:tetratricopeptide repeat protein [Candidatus Sumerlaeota bacterium]
MAWGSESLFVGRLPELRQFEEVLRDPKGQAVLVIGSEGIGKSALLSKMAECAFTHSRLRCGYVGYEITPVKSPNSLMEEMMHHAFEAAALKEPSINHTEKKKRQWRSFFNAFFSLAERQVDLISALRYEPKQDIYGQFLERLNFLSQNMPEQGRGILFIDTGVGVEASFDESWASVFQDIPPKIKIIFAQRPFKALPVGMERSSSLDIPNTVRIHLDALDEKAVNDLVEAYARFLQVSAQEIRKALSLYKGHPYALSAALEMLRDGEMIPNLPIDPKPESVADAQWNRVGMEYGFDAVRLFEAISVLDDLVPHELLCEVSTLSPANVRALVDRRFLNHLVRKDGDGTQIYHGIFRDHILGSMEKEDWIRYQRRAVDAYRRRIYHGKGTDELATRNLIKHLLQVAPPNEVIYTFINESAPRLIHLGLYETAIDYTRQLLKLNAASDKVIEATLKGNLGVIYRSQGRLDLAEQMQRRALDINRKNGNMKGMAYGYVNLGDIYLLNGKLNYAKSMYFNGLNISNKVRDVMGVVNACNGLGKIYLESGDLANAERSFHQALEINEKMNRLDGAAVQLCNLGLAFQKGKEYEKARDMYARALEIHEKLGDLEGMADNYYNMGVLYRQLDDFAQAEKMHEHALELFERMGNLKGMADVYVNLAGIYIALVDYRKAKKRISSALNLYKRLNIRDMAAKMANWLDSLPEQTEQSPPE